MTPAERQRESRAARKEGRQLKPKNTREQIARMGDKRVRWLHYVGVIEKYGIPELMEEEILENIGTRTLADLARHYDDDAQQKFLAIFRKVGARTAKRLINQDFRERGLRR